MIVLHSNLGNKAGPCFKGKRKKKETAFLPRYKEHFIEDLIFAQYCFSLVNLIFVLVVGHRETERRKYFD